MLLGQAESGKSTLQKQFQLYYSSSTLDRERLSWRPIVYFNVLKAVRMILDELDWEFGLGPSGSGSGSGLPSPSSALSSPSHSPAPSPSHSPRPSHRLAAPLLPSTSASAWTKHTSGSGSGSGSGSSTHSRPAAQPGWFGELGLLRNKLLPLVASEDALASELSGGIHVAGGRSGVYVRSGWQALTSGTRTWPLAEGFATHGGGHGGKGQGQGQGQGQGGGAGSAVTNIVAKTLAAVMDEVEMLWWHPGVQGLLKGHKLKLEEYAAL